MEDARKQQEQKRSYSPAQSDQTTRACTLRLSPRTLSLFYIENTSVHRKVCRRMVLLTGPI